MEIVVNEKTYNYYGRIVPQHYRTIVRKTDQMGAIKRVLSELESLAKMYSREFKEVEDMWLDFKCDKVKVREILAKQSFSEWSELEDLCVERGDRTSRQYKSLVKDKGLEEIERRRVYLSHAKA